MKFTHLDVWRGAQRCLVLLQGPATHRPSVSNNYVQSTLNSIATNYIATEMRMLFYDRPGVVLLAVNFQFSGVSS